MADYSFLFYNLWSWANWSPLGCLKAKSNGRLTVARCRFRFRWRPGHGESSSATPIDLATQAKLAVRMYRNAPRAPQFHPEGGQFDFVRPPARTTHPHGAHRVVSLTESRKSPPKKILPLFFS